MLTNEEYAQMVKEEKSCCPVCYQQRIVKYTDSFPNYLECTSCYYKWEEFFSYKGNNKYRISGYVLIKV